jgi:hypothetical protein
MRSARFFLHRIEARVLRLRRKRHDPKQHRHDDTSVHNASGKNNHSTEHDLTMNCPAALPRRLRHDADDPGVATAATVAIW